ncbi:acyl-CoA ligase (AMP-forming), exosortase A system-associated [Sphingorhabdus soli]|uniref:Acyl-CoA ligase (AMP-forming), exosortase A system-associated n=1 Tax=Flavisphingopyxis soli TaxID=2601267 RepID=A0A5C6UAN9_9SPHN|nr:acyl-CoA ligase (AMP-forming), exosortase A system-associated [Sphingorhabdus soli]TXC69301.1 acyl-CoA ligase (AMP-forming), exosortase A system-associated [Sphingorhabdus soli]
MQRGAASAIALETPRETLEFAAVEDRVAAMAAVLREHGLGPGDRVATWLAKTSEACLMPLAAARAGLIHVPVNPLLKRAQVAHILADSGARLLLSNAARIATLDPADGDAARVDVDDFADAVAATDDRIAQSPASPDDIAAILYTSGSTGKPKGVVLSHANLWLGAQSVAHYLKLSADDRTLCVLPLSFDYGQNQLFSTWYAGGACIPLDYLTPRDVMKSVARRSITTLAGVPPLWVQLVELDWADDAGKTLRRLTNSGGALTRPLVRRLRALFPDADLYPMYGLTEAFRSTYLDPGLVAAHPESMGRAIPFAEILVVRPDGSPTEADEPGELVHCGPLVAQGYWRDPARTAQRFKLAPAHSTYGGSAVWSGDSVRRDADGLLYFVGRDDAMIKSAGNRISPSEIEDAAVECDGVAEAVALGVKDDRLGEAIVLIVRGNRDDSTLRAHLRAELPNFMQPARIVWRDALPRNSNGKLDRVALANEIAQEVTS